MTKHNGGPERWQIIGENADAAGTPFIKIGANEIGAPGYEEVCHVQANGDAGDNFYLTKNDMERAALIVEAPALKEFKRQCEKHAEDATEYTLAVVNAELRRALAVAKCLYDNDELTRLGKHLERETKR